MKSAIHSYFKADCLKVDLGLWGHEAIERGDAAASLGHWNEAAAAYGGFVAREPGHWAGWLKYARSLQELGALEQAEIAYLRAVTLRPGDPDLIPVLEKVVERTKINTGPDEYVERSTTFTNANSDQLKASSVEINQHSLLLNLKTLAEKEAQLLRVLMFKEKHDAEWITVADHFRDKQDWGAAAQAYGAALAERPENAPIWMQYAHSLKELGWSAMAEAAYLRAVEINASDMEPLLHLAHLLKMLGRTEEALSMFRKLQISASYDVSADIAFLTHMKSHDVHDFQPVEVETAAPNAWISLGNFHRDAQEWKRAQVAYAKALDLDPTAAAIWVQYGHSLKENDNLDQAEEAYRKAASLDVNDPDPLLHLGHLLMRRGNFSKALTVFSQLSELPAQKNTVRLELAFLHEMVDQEAYPTSAAPTEDNLFAPSVREYPGLNKYVDSRPTILLVAHAASQLLFGSERSFLDMLDGLVNLPSNVVVALPINYPDYTNNIRRMACHVVVFKYSWWKDGKHTDENVTRIFEDIIKRHNISAVHSNTIVIRESLEAAKNCGIASIVHARELITEDKDLIKMIGLTPQEIVEKTLDLADWVVGNSNATASVFAKPGRTRVIPNTIDINAFDITNDLTDGKVRFGLISSNIPKKGVQDLVDLAILAYQDAPEAEFLLIGPETDCIRDILERQAQGSIPSNVVFAGYADSPLEAISKINVVINFSHFAESFGRTVLEGMAARRPTIAYAHGALPELVDHDKTGYLVSYMEPAQALQYVVRLSKDPALIKTLGNHGRSKAEESYSLSSYREMFADVYQEIFDSRGIRFKRARREKEILPARAKDIHDAMVAPRIAYFCWHFPVPSETFVLAELRAIVEAGGDVIVFCRQSPHKDFQLDFPVQYERVASVEELASKLVKHDRTIVHAHFAYPTVTDMVWPACEQAKIPFTFIAHAQDIFRHSNAERNRLAEIGASPWCRRMFTLSRFHADYVASLGFPKHKVVINANAVDFRRFKPVARVQRRYGHCRIVAICRFVEKKGIDLLIRAAGLLSDLNVTIDIYGYGDLERSYRDLIMDLGLENVKVHGRLSHEQVAEVLGSADLFACPSVQAADGDMDGIPTSIVESLASGVPVLATSIAGVPDLIQNEVTGLLAEPTPAGLATAIRRFCSMSSSAINAMVEAGRSRAFNQHDVVRRLRVLMRVWKNLCVDIVVVSWNNLPELKMVVDHVEANTALPYHLIICDNQSLAEPVPEFLDSLWLRNDRVTIIHNGQNAMVGPGTNTAIENGSSDYIIYICSKEGVSFARGWELAFIHHLEETPRAGLAGTLGYSPSYLHGSQLSTGIKLFDKFRNKNFAAVNPVREFRHVQGGLFAIRRAMYEEIGGFSNEVPHSYTDVEYSYYAESKGWELSSAPGVLALFNKSRPTLSQRFDENVAVAHPVLPQDLDRLKHVVAGNLSHCNICDWYGRSFRSGMICQQCGSEGNDRSLFRWLSESSYMFRRLPCLGIGLSGEIEKVWEQQFQGPRMGSKEFLSELQAHSQLKNRSSSMHIVLLRFQQIDFSDAALIASECARLLLPGGLVVLQVDYEDSAAVYLLKELLGGHLSSHGLVSLNHIIYSSSAIRFSPVPIFSFLKPSNTGELMK
jgi:glycosyltransferase involved in cell wall biosynthesis/GT2 family glycosyltransferase/predicted TPR repeat methyltransferase